MGGVLAKIVFKNGEDTLLLEKYKTVNEIPITLIDGNALNQLQELLKGDKKLYMIVNVASKWGLTQRNYTQLVQIHNEFKDKGLEIIGFPCNQFGN